MQVSYALLREGTTDIALKTIVERYAVTKDVELVFNEALSRPFNGPLGKGMLRIRTRNNFDNDAVELALYFADKDKGSFDKVEYIEDAIKSVSETYLTRCVVGVPDPHMEAWLLADQNTVKSVFSLPGDTPIPYADRPPKEQLELLANECGSDELTPPEARKRLSETLDLGVVERVSPSFNNFIRRFNEFINAYTQNR